jgi:Fe-S cluster assembly iron-binding protein IscA
MLELAPDAISAIEHILAAPAVPDEAGVRIAGSSPTGRIDTESDLQVTVTKTPDEDDEVIEADRARVFLGADAAGYLDDKLLHARVDRDDQVGFMISNQPS